jgi:hypothetical protein
MDRRLLKRLAPVVILVTLSTTALPAASVGKGTGAATAGTVSATSQPLPERHGGLERSMFVGSGALNFEADFARKNPGFARAIAAAEQVFQRRGFRKAEFTVVIHQLSEVKQARGLGRRFLDLFVRPVHAQGFGGPGGFMIATSWDDGDDMTWEGNLFWMRNDTGQSTNINVQLYLGTPAHGNPVEWEDPGGTNPQPPQPQPQWHGIDCNDPHRIPLEINKQVWGGAWWKIAGPVTFGCALTGPKFWGCLPFFATATVVGEGLRWIGEYAYVCVCGYLGDQYCP